MPSLVGVLRNNSWRVTSRVIIDRVATEIIRLVCPSVRLSALLWLKRFMYDLDKNHGLAMRRARTDKQTDKQTDATKHIISLLRSP